MSGLCRSSRMAAASARSITARSMHGLYGLPDQAVLTRSRENAVAKSSNFHVQRSEYFALLP
jgi:hypothetical protein